MMIKQYDEEDDVEIDLLALGRYLWDHILTIILVAVLSAAIAFGYSLYFIDPLYQAKTSMYVNNSSFSLGSSNFSISASELSAGNSLVDVYIYILNSRTTIEEIIRKAGVDYTYEEMLDTILSTEKVSNTAGFEVVATSTSPTEAETIANAVAEVLPDRIAEIVDGASVRIVDYAIIPSHRSSPSYVKNAAIGACIGILLTCIVLVVVELNRESSYVVIHDVDELKHKYPDIPILAMIPDMRYSGKRESYYSSYYGANYYSKNRAG